jgi:hypothetical protein
VAQGAVAWAGADREEARGVRLLGDDQAVRPMATRIFESWVYPRTLAAWAGAHERAQGAGPGGGAGSDPPGPWLPHPELERPCGGALWR